MDICNWSSNDILLRRRVRRCSWLGNINDRRRIVVRSGDGIIMKAKNRKNEHYSNLKTLLRLVTLGIAIWALVIAYQAKKEAEWNTSTYDLVIEKLMFPDTNK